MSDFKAKMHQIRFRLGLLPRPRWGSLGLQRSPITLAGFKGPTSKGRRREGRGGVDKGGEGEKGREGRGGEIRPPPPQNIFGLTPLIETTNIV